MVFAVAALLVPSAAFAEVNPAYKAKRVADIEAGPASGIPTTFRMAPFGDFLVFKGEDAAGEEPWITDGTPGGTRLLRDINPGPGDSSPEQFRVFDGVAYFAATDPLNGRELWRTDGTPEGTVLVANIAGGATSSVPFMVGEFRGDLYLTADTPTTGRELWKISPGGGLAQATNNLSTLSPDRMQVAGDYMYFVGNGGDGPEPWRTQGTDASTSKIHDISTAPSGSSPSNESFYDGVAFFGADDGMGSAIWRTNGVGATKIPTGGLSFGGPVARINGRYLLSSFAPITGNELYVTDGIAAPTLLKDINPAGSSLAFLPDNDDPLGIITADDGSSGRELWRTDGTTAGTNRVVNLNPGGSGANGSVARMADGAYVFGGDDGQTGMELFVTDGTAAGTRLLADFVPGPAASNPASLGGDPRGAAARYFTATTPGEGLELYVAGLPQLRGGSGDAGVAPLGNPRSVDLPLSASSPFDTVLGEATIEGPDRKSFSVRPGSCGEGTSLAARTSCQAKLIFTPHKKGTAQATLRFEHSDAQNPLLVPLTGTAGKDKKKPKLKARGKLRNGVVSIKAGCDEICTITASAKGLGKAKAKKIEPGKRAKLKLPKKGKAKGRVGAVKLKAVDLSGNKSGKKLKLK